MKKWEQENEALEPHQRRPLPQKPDASLSREEANEAAYRSYESTMVPCDNCGRTFSGYDRLEVHQRSCNSGVSRGSKSPGKSSPSPHRGQMDDNSGWSDNRFVDEDPVVAWARQRAVQGGRTGGEFKFDGVQF